MVAKGFCWGFCRRVVKRRWMKGSGSKEYREKKMGMVSVQWPVPLDTLDTQHMSSLGHVSRTQRVQWPLATELKLKQLDLYFCFFLLCSQLFNIWDISQKLVTRRRKRVASNGSARTSPTQLDSAINSRPMRRNQRKTKWRTQNKWRIHLSQKNKMMIVWRKKKRGSTKVIKRRSERRWI